MFNCPATAEQIDSACMSFRHDFGLLDEKKREDTRSAAKYWLEAWMKEGLVFDVDGKQQEIDQLRKQVAELNEKLVVASNVEPNTDLRTQIILLQSENRELKNQIETVTSPTYLAEKLEAVGVVDKEWKDIAEKRTEQVSVLNAALKIAMKGINDWMHIYAHDLCDENEVEAARQRVYSGGTLAYIAEINDAVRTAQRVAEYGGEDLPIDAAIAKIHDAPKLKCVAFLDTDKDGKTTNLVDGELAQRIVMSLRYENIRFYNDVIERIEFSHKSPSKPQGTEIDVAASDAYGKALQGIQQLWYDRGNVYLNDAVLVDGTEIQAIKDILVQFDMSLERQEDNSHDASLAVIANYGDIALGVLRNIATKSGEAA